VRALRAAGAALALIALLPALVASCRKPPGQRYPLKGVVASVNRAVREVVLTHEDIPGLMPAMTMPFPLTDPALLESLGPGDAIVATLVVGETSYRLEEVKVTHRAAPGATREAPPALGAEPNAGDEVPDVTLENQDGRPIRLSDYRGRALALTFIFTRCPLPDFCPRMGEHFAAVARELAKDPELRQRAHLLSVSFDPEYDTPLVLRTWGRRFLRDDGFDHFELARGEPAQIERLADFLTLDYEPDASSFTHNLRTAVIDPEGRLFRLHRGNDWAPATLLADLREAAAASSPLSP
jgi:protein SCO1/2